MQEEKTLTPRPQDKQGVNIVMRKCTPVKNFILKTIRQRKEITFGERCDLSKEELTDSSDGKVLWYVVTIKLHLETRVMIECIPKTSPYKPRLKK